VYTPVTCSQFLMRVSWAPVFPDNANHHRRVCATARVVRYFTSPLAVAAGVDGTVPNYSTLTGHDRHR